MKTVDEIINRHDYVRLNESLNNKVEELAMIIRNKMVELDLIDLGDYHISNISANGYAAHLLNDMDNNSVESSKFYYYCGDFNCPITPATSKSKLDFLNKAKDLLQELDRIETVKCEAIKEALTNN